MSAGFNSRTGAPLDASRRPGPCNAFSGFCSCDSCSRQQDEVRRRGSASSGRPRRSSATGTSRPRRAIPTDRSPGNQPNRAQPPFPPHPRRRRSRVRIPSVISNSGGFCSFCASTADRNVSSANQQWHDEPAEPARVAGGGATDLVLIRTSLGHTTRLQRQVAVAWSRMVSAARRAGIAAPLLSLRATSHTTAMQRRVWEAAVRELGSASEAGLWCVEPGTPAARSGLTIELDLGQLSSHGRMRGARSLPAYRWLQAHARRFGFEPSGRSAARWRFVTTEVPQFRSPLQGETAANLAFAPAAAKAVGKW